MADELDTVSIQATKPDQSLQSFMSQDFLKSSQFMFVLPSLPFDYSLVSPRDPRGFSMFCESVEFPGKNTQAVDYKIPGKNRIRVPYSKEYPEVTMTFIHNISIPVYDIFSYWIDWAIQDNTSIESRYFDELVADFTLFQYSEFPAEPYGKFKGLGSILNSIDKINRYLFDSKKLFKVTDIGQEFINNINNVSGLNVSKQAYYTVQFKNAYPLSFAAMPSNWSDEGFHRLSVTFTYESYTINDSSKSSATSQLEQLSNFKLKADTFLSESNRSLDEILKQLQR